MANPTAELFVKIGADTKGLKTGLNQANSQMGKFATGIQKHSKIIGLAMTAMGIAIAAALAKMVFSYAKAGDEVHKMALRTGFATEALSELRHVAMLSGTELGSIEKATKRMSRAIIDAGRGLETYARVFRDLGLNIEELRAMKPEEQFWAIAGAIGDLEDQTLKAALAQEVFGRAGTDLLPMLASGSEAISEMRQEAHDLGIVFNEEAAAKAAKLTDSMGTLKESLQGVGFALAEELVPIITEFLNDKVIPLIQRIKDWIKENEDLAKNLLIIAGILIAGGALLLGLSLVAKAIMAINAALVIMHGLSGPAGWAALAAGIVIAGAAIYGITELMKSFEASLPEAPEGYEYYEFKGTEHEPILVPSKQYGGIVPGPTGAPVPIIAHGGEEFAGVGKSSRPVNIYIGSYMGDESSLRALSRKIKEIMGQDTRRTSFPSINRLEYFPGSSAP